MGNDVDMWEMAKIYCAQKETHIFNVNNNNNDFISIALFHVKHAQLR